MKNKLFILQNRDIIDKSQIEIQLLKNKILSKCLNQANRNKISKILIQTDFQHFILGLKGRRTEQLINSEIILNELYNVIKFDENN